MPQFIIERDELRGNLWRVFSVHPAGVPGSNRCDLRSVSGYVHYRHEDAEAELRQILESQTYRNSA